MFYVNNNKNYNKYFDCISEHFDQIKAKPSKNLDFVSPYFL